MTATIHEPARQIDVIRETDVLVVGSGPGGLAAALACARAGVETILLERYGCFGGNITQVGVEGFAWYRHPATIDSEGIGREFEERAKAMGAAMPEPQSISHSLDAEGFKVVADALVGHEHVLRDLEPSMGAEDFSFMLQTRPGAYLRIGQGAENGVGSCGLHNSRYDFNDDVLPLGSALHAGLVEQAMPLSTPA